MSDNKMEESPYKKGLLGTGFDNPLTSEGICQVLGRDTELWSNRIASAVNNTYGKGINPEAVLDLKKCLEELLAQFEKVVEPKYTLDFMLIREAKAAIEKAQIK